ncbi:hypothetical protein [Planktotalea sp.]|uniref:hypothetical protein n=1 Tax=Planktotalea sp. TaxID=2029877 RepID=UPI003299DDA2
MDIKRIVMAGGVLATAGAIGFVMQNGDTAKARYAQTTVPDISGTASDPLEVTDIALTSSSVVVDSSTEATPKSSVASDVDTTTVEMPAKEMEEPVIRTAGLGDVAVPSADMSEADAPAALCDIDVTAVAADAAMVDLSLSADCYPNERVTFHHNGMMFTDATDENGKLDLYIPALAENAVIIVAFSNGEGALANARVPSLVDFDRYVVQSKAKSELHINAFEFGANFRDEGHVDIDSDRTMADAAVGTGGFITSLGDATRGDDLMAEVYTFPTALTEKEGDVHVSVDAQVTTANCGLDIDAQTLEVRRAGQMKVQDLSLQIPACDAVGDFLVLQNLLQDLKVARN